MKGNTTYPEERRFIYIFRSVNNTTHVVNYCADNNYLNSFLKVFDIWGSDGERKISDDNNHLEVWFEMEKEFYDIVKTDTMQNAIKRFGVEVKIV